MDDNDILNCDVSPRNFLVFQPPQADIRVLMIDFGLCRIWNAKDGEDKWGSLKCVLDEEDCVVHRMQKLFKERHFELSYQKTEK